jgi:tetratricopeptide (TPR) repeat protein
MVLILLLTLTQEPAVDLRALLTAGQQAYAKHDYATAAAKFEEVTAAGANSPAVALEALRFLAAVDREKGDLAAAESALQRAVDLCVAGGPYSELGGLRSAAVLEELAQTQRAAGHADLALATIGRALTTRSRFPDAPRLDVARDLTFAGLMNYAAGDVDKATGNLLGAIQEWDAASPGDFQSIAALDALAGIYRDQSKYAEAEPLLLRALRLREAASGPDSAEVIASVDSLGYVEFGLRKLPETEILYKRLLALWSKNAGEDHPMVALTLDKLAEFYAYQQHYPEAQDAATKALALRVRVHIASLNQTGRILVMEAKLDEAAELYRRALEIGDLAKAPDDALDPVRRTYVLILRRLKRNEEADALQKKIDAAVPAGDLHTVRPDTVRPDTIRPR